MSAALARRALEAAGGPATVGVLAATLAAGCGVLLAAGVPAAALPEVWSVRAASAALAAALLAALVEAGRTRRAARALAALGLLALLAHGWRVTALAWEGTLELGEGEAAAQWATVVAGRPGAPPPIQLEAASAAGGGTFRLRLEGRRVEAGLGQEVALGGLSARVADWAPAPLVGAMTEQGAMVDQALARIRLHAERPEYVELGELPHRFYLTSAAPAEGGATPDRLQLRIQRGKLTVRRLEVLKAHAIRFDGLLFRYDDGSTWVRLEVRRRPGPWLLAVGAALLAGGAALAWRGRRAARRGG